MSLINGAEITTVSKLKEANKLDIRTLREFDTNTKRKGNSIEVTSETGFVTKCHEVNSFNKDVELTITSKFCDSDMRSRRRPKKNVTVVTDNVEWCLLQGKNEPTDKNREKSKKIKLIPSGKQLEWMYEDNQVLYNDILPSDSSNHHFPNNSEYTETLLTGRSMINEENIAVTYNECGNKVSRCIPQKLSLQPRKKEKTVRNMDNRVRMSFKSFAEQYSMYAASVSGKEDFQNLRDLVRSKTPVNKNSQKKITLNSNFKISSKQKSAGFIEQQIDIEKQVQPVGKEFTHRNSNIMRTPGSPAAISTVSVPLSGIKKLASAPEFLLVMSQKETVTTLRSSGDAENNFEYNEPPIFRGVVAFVDVHSQLFEYLQDIKEVMLSLGAKVEKTFSRQVTHVIFKDGTLSTYSKAKKFNIPLISVLWVEACRREQTLLPFQTFVPFGLEKYDLYLITHTDKDSGMLTCHTFAAEQYPTENTIKCYTCVEKQSISEIQCDDTKKHQKLAGKFRSAHETIVLIDSSNKEVVKMKENLHLQKSSNESTVNKVDDDSCIEKCKALSKVNRKSAPARLMTLRNSKNKKPCSKENSKGCRIKLETYKIGQGMFRLGHNSSRTNILKTQNCWCQTSLDDKNENEKCYHDNCRSAYKNDIVQNKNFVPEFDRNLNTCNKGSEAQSDRNSGVSHVNSEVIIGSLKPTTVKKRKRKLLPLDSSICISTSPLDCATDKSLCSPYYDLTLCQDTSDMDNPVLVSGSRGVISEVIPLIDKEKLEVCSFLRKESCALFIENKAKRHDLCQRLMATIVCTSMSHKDVVEVESVVHKLGRFRVENKVSYRTTHVVTCKPRRTMNLLKGIARGCWILLQDWVIKSGVAEKWLNEERFELTEFSPAVKQCRLERQAFGPVFSLDLFAHAGMIYVCHGTSPTVTDLIELLQLCGGNIVNNIDAADVVIGKHIRQAERGPLFVSEKWILDSVTRNTQLDPHRYKIIT